MNALSSLAKHNALLFTQYDYSLEMIQSFFTLFCLIFALSFNSTAMAIDEERESTAKKYPLSNYWLNQSELDSLPNSRLKPTPNLTPQCPRALFHNTNPT